MDELEALKQEMGKLANHLEAIDVDIDSVAVSCILGQLLDGHTSSSIINEFGLIDEAGV